MKHERKVDAYIPIGPYNPDGKIIVMANSIDSFYKSLEAKPGERQRALVLASFEINEDETGWKYPEINDALLQAVYGDRYFPAYAERRAWEANHSLQTFAKSLERGRKQAVKIANEVRAQRDAFHNLTDKEIIDVIFNITSFKQFAKRTRIHEE